MSQQLSAIFANKLKKLIVGFLLDKKIPLTLEYYFIDFQKITDIFYFLKSVYMVFFRKVDRPFYEFVIYVLNKLYNYKYLKFTKNNCLMFECQSFEIYVLLVEKPDEKLSIRHEFTLKNGSVHQCEDRCYTVLALISKGSYGKVYRCKDEHGNLFAMKLFQEKKEISIELKALNYLEHVNGIIKPIDVIYFNLLGVPFGAFTMLYIEYTLKSYVEKNNLSENFMLYLFYQLLLILRDSHANEVIHMDVKPENILISVHQDGSIDICLADLGLSEILPKGTHYAITKEPKITSWFRCICNSFSDANNEMFHISWISDLYAMCVSMLYMMSFRISPKMSPYAPPSGKQFDFFKSIQFDIFRNQNYFMSHDSSSKEMKVDIDRSTREINRACQIVRNPFFRNLLMTYMSPESILRWYSELKTSPKNNSVIPEVIAKMETYFRLMKVVAELNVRFKWTESDTETPPRPHATMCP